MQGGALRSQMNHSSQGLVVLLGAVPVPGSDVPLQETLDGAVVEILHYLIR